MAGILECRWVSCAGMERIYQIRHRSGRFAGTPPAPQRRRDAASFTGCRRRGDGNRRAGGLSDRGRQKGFAEHRTGGGCGRCWMMHDPPKTAHAEGMGNSATAHQPPPGQSFLRPVETQVPRSGTAEPLIRDGRDRESELDAIDCRTTTFQKQVERPGAAVSRARPVVPDPTTETTRKSSTEPRA